MRLRTQGITWAPRPVRWLQMLMRVFGYIDFEGCEIIDARCTVGPADIFLWLFHFKLSIAFKFQSSPGCQRVENNEKQETSSGAMKHCFESLDFDQRFRDSYQTARYGRGSKCKAPIHTWTHRRSIAPIHPHDPYIASGYDPYPLSINENDKLCLYQYQATLVYLCNMCGSNLLYLTRSIRPDHCGTIHARFLSHSHGPIMLIFAQAWFPKLQQEAYSWCESKGLLGGLAFILQTNWSACEIWQRRSSGRSHVIVFPCLSAAIWNPQATGLEVPMPASPNARDSQLWRIQGIKITANSTIPTIPYYTVNSWRLKIICVSLTCGPCQQMHYMAEQPMQTSGNTCNLNKQHKQPYGTGNCWK